jgi:hypothetical protein
MIVATAPLEKSRSVHYLRVILQKRPQQRGVIVHGVLHVRVLDQRHVARRALQAGADGGALAPIGRVAHQLHLGVSGDDLRRAVRGGIVDDDHLHGHRRAQRGEIHPAHRLQHAADGALLVESGQDY